MDRGRVQEWLDRYVSAWKSNDPEAIGALFSDDVFYRWHPWDEGERGREAVVAAWLHEPDEPGTFDARYEVFAIDGDAVVATGSSTYLTKDKAVDRVYDNCFVMRFNDAGECREFTEWYMKQQKKD